MHTHKKSGSLHLGLLPGLASGTIPSGAAGRRPPPICLSTELPTHAPIRRACGQGARSTAAHLSRLRSCSASEGLSARAAPRPLTRPSVPSALTASSPTSRAAARDRSPCVRKGETGSGEGGGGAHRLLGAQSTRLHLASGRMQPGPQPLPYSRRAPFREVSGRQDPRMTANLPTTARTKAGRARLAPHAKKRARKGERQAGSP